MEVSVRYRFPAQADRKRIQTLRASCAFLLKSIEFDDFFRCSFPGQAHAKCARRVYQEVGFLWPLLPPKYHFPAQASGILNRQLREGRVRLLRRRLIGVHFPAGAQGILNRYLREGRVKPLRMCRLESIFLHRLEEY